MVIDFDLRSWDASGATDLQARASAAIEDGAVLHFPVLAFPIEPGEDRLFSIALGRGAKNISYSPATGRIAGAETTGIDAVALTAALARFSRSAVALARGLFPQYATRLDVARASFRPAEIAGRQVSWRKDDTRLHVDSFPSAPTGGRRILRVFSNVNPVGRPRIWRIGAPFPAVADRYRPRLQMPWPGSAVLLRTLRITKTRRTPYDALMLQLHDLMKQDNELQSDPGITTIRFEPGSAWLAFTDEVAHAAMAGQFQFEQTILLPVEAMADQVRSPLRVLERAMGRPLA